jgi:hypothetical protein
MSHATAARKHRKAPHPMRAIAIALSEVGAAKRSRVSHNWRHAMSTRTRTVFLRLFPKTH